MRLPCDSINVRERPWASKRRPINCKRCCADRLNPQVITGHVRFAEDVDFAVESLTFVDIHYRFSLRVQDGPLRPAEYAARHIGGYADILITRLYEKRSRFDLVDNREVVVH